MFEDITNEKKKLLKSILGYDVTTKLNADTITQKIINDSKYFNKAELLFSIDKLKDGTIQLIFRKDDKVEEFILNDGDTLKLTHTFSVK